MSYATDIGNIDPQFAGHSAIESSEKRDCRCAWCGDRLFHIPVFQADDASGVGSAQGLASVGIGPVCQPIHTLFLCGRQLICHVR
jgi:hypothetical protein